MKPKGTKNEQEEEGKAAKTSEGPNAVKKPSCRGGEGQFSRTSEPVLRLASLCRTVCDHSERGDSATHCPETCHRSCQNRTGQLSLSPHSFSQNPLRSGLLSALESATKGDFPRDLYNA